MKKPSNISKLNWIKQTVPLQTEKPPHKQQNDSHAQEIITKQTN